jgi:hypothetical protein
MNEAIITDVTRMLPPKVCIAALQGTRTIRLNRPQPDEQILSSIGGLLPGDRVAVEWLDNPFYVPPHVEDGDWEPETLRKLDRLTKPELVDLLLPGVTRSVGEAFGQEWFRGAKGNGAFHPGTGERSLASVLAREVRVYQWFQSVRVDFEEEGGRWTHVPLEDLSVRRHQVLCEDCVTTPNRTSRFNQNLRSEFWDRDVLLRVGLTRPFEAEGQETACWLQVTGVYPIGKKRQHFA